MCIEEEIPIATVSFEEAQRLADLGAILQDLKFTMATCLRLEKFLKEGSDDSLLIESLWTSALIRYARCFATGKRFGLDEKVFDGLEGEPIKTHKFYIDLRSKHIAHSVNPFEQMEVGLILASKTQKKKEIIGVATLSMRQISSNEDGVHQLGLLAKVLADKVAEYGKEYERKVLEKGKTIPIDELYSASRPRITAPGPDLASLARTKK